jgi:hypothetical protein
MCACVQWSQTSFYESVTAKVKLLHIVITGFPHKRSIYNYSIYLHHSLAGSADKYTVYLEVYLLDIICCGIYFGS